MTYKQSFVDEYPYLVYTSEPDTTYEPAQDDADDADDADENDG